MEVGMPRWLKKLFKVKPSMIDVIREVIRKKPNCGMPLRYLAALLNVSALRPDQLPISCLTRVVNTEIARLAITQHYQDQITAAVLEVINQATKDDLGDEVITMTELKEHLQKAIWR